jgi:hypothetical protein
MGETEVKKIETALGSYGAAGQLQQRPAPREGGMFKRKWFEVVTAAPANLEEVGHGIWRARCQTVGSDPDWTAGVKIGRCRRRLFLDHERRALRATRRTSRNARSSARQQDGKPCRVRIPQDPGQAGKSQAQRLIRMLGGYIVRAVPPTGEQGNASDAIRGAGRSRATSSSSKAIGTNPSSPSWRRFRSASTTIKWTPPPTPSMSCSTATAGFLAMVRADNRQAAVEREAAEQAAVEEASRTLAPIPRAASNI